MFVTGCSIATTTMTPEEARHKIVMHQDDTDTVGNAADQLRVLAGLCNSAEFDITTSHLSLNERKINGDATGKAVLRFSESLGETAYLHCLWKKEFELAFNSKNKFMIRTYSLLEAEALKYSVSPGERSHYDSDKSCVQASLSAPCRSRLLTYERNLLTIKGAPDSLVSRCSHYTSMNGDSHKLDETTLSTIEEIKNQWSSQGRRVILLARKILSKSGTWSDDTESEVLHRSRDGLTLVGLVSIVDPPRNEIPQVVRTLRGAGIRIFMMNIQFSA